MNLCEICLENNGDSYSRININSSEWIENNMQEIIGKHLSWLYLNYHNVHEQWICQQCWLELSSFNKFYNRIEKAHTLIPSLTSNIKCEQIFIDPDDENHLAVVKQECKDTENGTSNFANELSWNSIPVSVQVGEFEIVDIKAEPSHSNISPDSQPEPIQPSDEETDSNFQYSITHATNDDEYSNIHNFGKNPVNRGTRIKNDEFIAANHKLYCNLCNELLPDFTKLKNHFRDTHNTRGYATCCGKHYHERFALVDHIHCHLNPDYFKCQECATSFMRRSHFIQHVKEHNKPPEEMVKCGLCEAMFTNSGILRRHINRIHVEENQKERLCPICSKMSPSLEAHRAHMKYHRMPRKHACHLCDKAFKYAHQLREHISTHTGEALYTCSHCPKTFISSSNMYKHQRHNHPKEWEEDHAKKPTRRRGKNKDSSANTAK